MGGGRGRGRRFAKEEVSLGCRKTASIAAFLLFISLSATASKGVIYMAPVSGVSNGPSHSLAPPSPPEPVSLSFLRARPRPRAFAARRNSVPGPTDQNLKLEQEGAKQDRGPQVQMRFAAFNAPNPSSNVLGAGKGRPLPSFLPKAGSPTPYPLNSQQSSLAPPPSPLMSP